MADLHPLQSLYATPPRVVLPCIYLSTIQTEINAIFARSYAIVPLCALIDTIISRMNG